MAVLTNKMEEVMARKIQGLTALRQHLRRESNTVERVYTEYDEIIITFDNDRWVRIVALPGHENTASIWVCELRDPGDLYYMALVKAKLISIDEMNEQTSLEEENRRFGREAYEREEYKRLKEKYGEEV